MALGFPGRLRPRIFSTFGTTRVVGRQPNAPATFTPGEVPGTHFQRLSRPQGTWFCRKEPRKKSQVTPPGIDPGTVRLAAQRLNHYATPGPTHIVSVGGYCCTCLQDTHTHTHTTFGRTPPDEDRSVAETTTWQHTTLTRCRHPCYRRDLNPKSQQAIGHTPMP